MSPPREHEDDGGGQVAVAKPKLKRPPMYACVLHNDDYTTMEFVVEVLQKFFSKNVDEAARIMLDVHQKGKGTAGVYSFEIAETKAAQVVDYARIHQYPLLCTVEPA